MTCLTRLYSLCCLILVTAPLPSGALLAATPPGVFDDQSDVGHTAKAGAAKYDADLQVYAISGGGDNMWARTDAFHFVWKRMSGDVSLSADIRWPASGGQPHRKACLMIRQSLDADSAYVDAALHGDGLTSLQFRLDKGETTSEIQSNVARPARIRIEKQGDVCFMSVGPAGESPSRAGGSIKIRLKEPFYVGLAVCAHDNAALETAEFSHVDLGNQKHIPAAKPLVESTLETLNIASKDRRAVYRSAGRIEAPNWITSGNEFLFNSNGRIYRLPRAGGQPQLIDTAFANRCNNDHGLSPDGTTLAISHHADGGRSLIYLLPSSGGVPKQLTPAGPSHFHGWSPDGKAIVYCAERNKEFDIYSIPTSGGQETRLTSAKGLDDGPEFAPDGKHIYFNSERSGMMQIWRMRPDGSEQEQVTDDSYNNWFPHPSPDGKWIVFLSFEKGVQGHPADKDVLLRIMPIAGGATQTLARIFGGQGTINVSSWSPDSRNVAYVSYQLVNP